MKNDFRYCSQKCSGLAHRKISGSRLKNCLGCGKEFKAKSKGILGLQKYCSCECSNKAKCGITPRDWRITIFDLPEYKEWRMAVIIRDGGICKECFAKKRIKNHTKLIAHHIIPIRVDKSKTFDINNGITLCKLCHYKTLNKEEEFIDYYYHLLQLPVPKVDRSKFKKQLNPHQILRKQLLGYSHEELAKHFYTSKPTLVKCLKTIGKTGVQKDRVYRLTKATFYSVIKMVEQGASYRDMIRQLHTTSVKLKHILQLWGVNILHRSTLKASGLTGNTLRKMQHMKKYDIARIFGINVDMVTGIMKKYKVIGNPMQKNNTSGFKGVFKRGLGWDVAITTNKKRMYIGHFTSKIKATKAYNAKALELFGEFAWLNPINELERI